MSMIGKLIRMSTVPQLACTFDGFPIEVDTVWVEDAQSPLEGAVRETGKYLFHELLIAVSMINLYVTPLFVSFSSASTLSLSRSI